MKVSRIKKSLFFSISIIIFIRLLLYFVPIYTSEAIIKLKDQQFKLNRYRGYTGKNYCLNINTSYDEISRETKFNLTSRSIKKDKSIECIKDGVNHIETLIIKRNAFYEELFYKSIDLNNKIDASINDFNVSKNIDKDKLILMNEYFRNINILRNKEKVSLPLPYEIKTNPIRNYNLFRFLFTGFIIIFWMSYLILSDFKKY